MGKKLPIVLKFFDFMAIQKVKIMAKLDNAK